MMGTIENNEGPSGEAGFTLEEPLEIAEYTLSNIARRIEEKRADTDWQEEVDDLMESSRHPEQEANSGEKKYYGHDMSTRCDSTGCRIATVNAANACPIVREGTKVIENLIEKVIAESIDIMIIHEPGTINPKEAAAMRAAARLREVNWDRQTPAERS